MLSKRDYIRNEAEMQDKVRELTTSEYRLELILGLSESALRLHGLGGMMSVAQPLLP